jgi:hypothetical protein
MRSLRSLGTTDAESEQAAELLSVDSGVTEDAGQAFRA